MENTGVFATSEEKEYLMGLVRKAQKTPVILLFGKHDAWKRVKEECHKAALAHGLPEIVGYYGMDEDGEFVSD
jgi:hypothetical protein